VKIRADEHVSPEIVLAINKLALGSDCSLDSVYTAGQRGIDDVPWVTRFARDGGKVILSADTDFHKKPHQIAAVHELGLMVVQLPSRWANARRRMQASHILY
jgi:PIN like domain